MLITECLCAHIIRVLHTLICVYDEDGNQTAVYADHGEQQDVLACDPDFLAFLLKEGERGSADSSSGRGGDCIRYAAGRSYVGEAAALARQTEVEFCRALSEIKDSEKGRRKNVCKRCELR